MQKIDKDNCITFNNSYVKLPSSFYQHIDSPRFPKPTLIHFNHALAEELGIKYKNYGSDMLANIFCGNITLQGAEPIALAYAGHQFGHFVPQLGDGRALLLGEVINSKNQRRDIQLKGSGITQFSRQGDGRAPLSAVMREYVISEAMYVLGIPTTRSLAIVKTGEVIKRAQIILGAVLTRIAASHIRVGTFEYFAYKNDILALKQLADYVINRHYPDCKNYSQPYRALLRAVIEKQASLIAKWMSVGFIHGVMNTDNVSIAGETLDYGPCAFLDEYDDEAVFSSIDRYGRYAFNQQIVVGEWNMRVFGQCILPLLSTQADKAVDIVQQEIERFSKLYKRYWLANMRRKIGLMKDQEEDLVLIEELLRLMKFHRADYTLTFRYLGSSLTYSLKKDLNSQAFKLRELFRHNPNIELWLRSWRLRLKSEDRSFADIKEHMCNINPAFIARNHLVEDAIDEAVEHNTFTKMNRLINILSMPFENQPEHEMYMLPPQPHERVMQTFCGT